MALKIIEQGPNAAALRRENFPAGTLPGRHLVIANSAPPPDRQAPFRPARTDPRVRVRFRRGIPSERPIR
jgi:hypothetical protein